LRSRISCDMRVRARDMRSASITWGMEASGHDATRVQGREAAADAAAGPGRRRSTQSPLGGLSGPPLKSSIDGITQWPVASGQLPVNPFRTKTKTENWKLKTGN
jgi:hypothetical protein